MAIQQVNAWVQVTAVNQEQTRNTMGLMPVLMSEKLIATYNIVPGAELTRALGGRSILQAVTSSYRAIEGKRTTFALLNETHHWVEGNKGHDLYETIDGNATKMDSRYLAITNAYLPGEDSVAERMREAWQKVQDGRAADAKMLYDSIEAHPSTPLTPDALRVVLPIIRGDAIWLNVEGIVPSVLNTQIAPSRSRRMYLNQIVAEEDALYGPEHWALEANGGIGREDVILAPGEAIVMGFDGGKTDDATALVAIRVKDATAFVLGCWEKPDGPLGEGWVVDRFAVDGEVREALRLYDVKAFYADVALWESYIDDWAEDFGESLVIKASEKHAIAWDMRRSQQLVVRAHERLMRAIFDRKLRYNADDKDLRRHALNAMRASNNNYGVSFRKESRESPRKVDLYAALLLAFEALHDVRTRPQKKVRERTYEGIFL